MEVREIMSSPVVTAAPEDTLRTAVERMLEERVGSVVVLDDGLAGIVTESDVLRACYSEDVVASEASDPGTASDVAHGPENREAAARASGDTAGREVERQRGLDDASGERQRPASRETASDATDHGDASDASERVASRDHLESMRVADVMSTDLVTATSTTSVTAALRTMQDHDVKRLPIRGGSKPLGIVTLSDVAWHLPDRLRERPGLSTRQKGRGRD